jgi:hypothetical protein
MFLTPPLPSPYRPFSLDVGQVYLYSAGLYGHQAYAFSLTIGNMKNKPFGGSQRGGKYI